MADKKISQLTDLPAASVSPSNDVLAIVDTNVTETKKITAKALVDGALNAGTANGLVYLNGSKETTTGSIITYDGTTFKVDDAVVINESGGDNDTRIEGDTDANLFFVDASTDRVGVGTGSPGAKLDVRGNATFTGNATARQTADFTNTGGQLYVGAESSSGGAVFTGSSAYAGIIGTNTNTVLQLATNGTVRATIDPSGTLGLGVTPSAWSTGSSRKVLQVGTASMASAANSQNITGANYYFDGTNNLYIGTGNATAYQQITGQHQWFTAPSGTAGNNITFSQAMTLDASGNLGLGTTTADIFSLGFARNSTVAVTGASTTAAVNISGGAASRLVLGVGSTRYGQIYQDSSNYMEIVTTAALPIVFSTDSTQRARITAGGDLLVGTTNTGPAAANVTGVSIRPGGFQSEFTGEGGPGLGVNRKANDGNMVVFYQDGTQEGSISVSGNTVSYNAFAGSHWSQLQDGSKPDILRGTVMESINELCVWPGEENERLPKAKISDTAGSKKVYGVFMAWDNDWTETNDMYVTAVGAFICRVNGSVTVQEGDLLESNGDGTARVQADDIIRSSTIGKVTSTVKTHEYDDGSYCVPTVLYCG